MATTRTAPRPILVADDNPDDLLFITRLFSKSDLHFEIQTAASGAEALATLRKDMRAGRKPAAIAVDLNMPKMTGFEVLHWIRGQKELRGVPVVIVTDRDDPTDRQLALEGGADRFVVKSPHQHELIEALRDVSEARSRSAAPATQ